MPFVVIARSEKNESTTSHEQATEAYEQAIRLLEDGTSYVAIRDEQGKEYSSGEFAACFLNPVAKRTTDQA
jgi:23S rRNA pseudoU1915 N3-methylase RlmH